jgi:hypothetical protein
MDTRPPSERLVDPSAQERAGILERNLRALSVCSAAAAARIRSATPRVDFRAHRTDDGTVAGEVRLNGGAHRLCSFRRPIDEAERLAASFDPKAAAVAVVVGFGMGHHVRAVVERLKGQGGAVVYEPDVPLLRAVFEVVDHSGWLAANQVRIHCEGSDQAGVNAAFDRLEGHAAVGMKIIEHPPSAVRLGEDARRFTGNLTGVVAAMRTHVVTALCQVEKTVGNYLSNIGVYAAAGSVEDLRDAAKGRTAVVVSAGPSLARNLHLLGEPGVRERVVIVAAQTVLKPMLAKGIKPHFVTALDHAEISARFFEGLTAADVEGVTLVVEPKANPAIAAAFPGTVRCTSEPVLDSVLGSGLARRMGTLPSGSTVAHLSYYLARHLGCDPVVLIGQDLGFTDGQYYAAGAAIHQVWSGELNPFNTLETMEWQRIVRMRRMLHRAEDHLGRAMYTDEQMQAYRLQFERDFAVDESKGLTTIDATEGGVRKAHTRIATLRGALAGAVGEVVWTLPDAARTGLDVARREAVLERLVSLRGDASAIKDLCAKTQGVLGSIKRHAGNHAKVNPLIDEARRLGEEAQALTTAYSLVQYVNQTGQLRRYRRDRLIALDEHAGAVQKQKRQVERDIENLEWIAEAADEVGAMAAKAGATLRGEAFESRSRDRASAVTGAPGPKAKARVGAVIPVHTATGGIDTRRDLAEPIAGGRGALWWTVARLLRVERLDRVVLVTHEPACVRGMLDELARDPRVAIHETTPDPMGARRRSVAVARRWARASWRGGIGNMTVFDEAFAPAATAAAMERESLDAAVIVGADWALVDPASVAAMVDRYRAAGGETGSHELMVVHAAAGLGACLIERGPIEEPARGGATAGPFSSVGALTGYLPFLPQMDLIGKPAAIMRSPAARDLGVRCVVDTAWARRVAGAVLGTYGVGADLETIVAACEAAISQIDPAIVSIDLGSPGAWIAESAVVAAVRSGAAAVTLTGSTEHPAFARIVAAARDAGAAVHVVTPAGDAGELRRMGVEVVSVPMISGDGAVDDTALAFAETLAASALMGEEGLPDAWVVPRIERRDATYERIEMLYDAWVARCGACVIDPSAVAREGERIMPLPVPACVRERREREEVIVSADGVARTPGGRVVEGFSERASAGLIELKRGEAAMEAA